MKLVDWQMICFVGSTLVVEYWSYWGLPKIYYWQVKKTVEANEDDNKIA